MKILTIVGARPQFVKAAALSRCIANYPELTEVIVHTGQHFDANMSDIFFDEMEIPKPDFNLNINGLSHGAMTGQMLEGIEKIILSEKPDVVLVYGDTNSTLAGSLAAKKLQVKIAHVEAGLRSFNMAMPEEINRILTDRISDWLFCPTTTAIENLRKEGFDSFNSKVIKTGDIMEDAAYFYASKAEEKSKIIKDLKLAENGFVLGTIHRAENTDDLNKLTQLIEAFEEINKTIKVIIPLHPRTKQILKHHNIQTNFTIIDPVGYFDMLMLLKNCALVVTDSGGLQKEAFFFRKFGITTREQTEWTELIDNGYNFLAGTNKELILAYAFKLIGKKFPEPKNLYGNGEAANNICKALIGN
ncbi:MAG: UDP-N-acetylglucosamine 2-epimerase (non-hydrolyzing) [Bacteroidota bacterium]